MNKINWEYSHNDKNEAIWKGTTDKGAVFYGVKENHEIKDIKLSYVPKRERVLTDFDKKVQKAKDYINSLDRHQTFIMYEKLSYIRHFCYNYSDHRDTIELVNNDLQFRLYGWAIVARLVELDGVIRMEFYSSICSKKDLFCKQVAVYEAFKNTPIYSIHIPHQSFNDNLRIFNAICKASLIPRIEKKTKRRI
jgi:hypothetical protein